jgi:hypothetical protein
MPIVHLDTPEDLTIFDSDMLHDFYRHSRDASLTGIYQQYQKLRGRRRYRPTGQWELEDNESERFVAVDGDAIMGIISFKRTDNGIFVNEFTTREHSDGYGRTLFEAVLDILYSDNEVTVIRLCSTTSAIGFYLHMGLHFLRDFEEDVGNVIVTRARTNRHFNYSTLMGCVVDRQ